MRKRITGSALAVVITVLCLGAVPNFAVAQGGDTAAKVGDAHSAFAAGSYGDVITITQDILASVTDADTRADALGMLIQSIRWQSGCKAAIDAASAMKQSATAADADALSNEISTLSEMQASYEQAVAEKKSIVNGSPASIAAADADLAIARLRVLYDSKEQAVSSLEYVANTYASRATGEQATQELWRLYDRSRSYAEGAIELAALGQTHPQTRTGSAAAYYAGKLLAAHGDNPGAYAAYLESPRRSDKSIAARDAIEALIELSTAMGNEADLLIQLAQVEQLYPKTDTGAYALSAIGRLYEADGKPDWAYTAYRKIATDYTSIPATVKDTLKAASANFYKQAFAEGGAGKYGEAAVQFQKSLDMLPDREQAADSLYQQAIAYHANGQDIESIAAFKKLSSDYTDSYLSIRAQGWIEKIESK